MKKRILSLMLILCIFGGITGYMPVGAATDTITDEALFMTYPSYLSNSEMDEGLSKAEAAYYAVLNSYSSTDEAVSAFMSAMSEGISLTVKDTLGKWGIGETLYEEYAKKAATKYMQALMSNENAAKEATKKVNNAYKALKASYDIASSVDKSILLDDLREIAKTHDINISVNGMDKVVNKLYDSGTLKTDLDAIGEANKIWEYVLEITELHAIEMTAMQLLIDELTSSGQTGSDLYLGLTLLKKDIESNQDGYVLKKYINSKIVSYISKNIDKFFCNLVDSSSITVAFVTTFCKVYADYIYADAKADELIQATMQTSFISSIDICLSRYRTKFLHGTGTSEDIEIYENLYAAYLSAYKSCLESCNDVAKLDDKYTLGGDCMVWADEIEYTYTYDTYLRWCKEEVAHDIENATIDKNTGSSNIADDLNEETIKSRFERIYKLYPPNSNKKFIGEYDGAKHSIGFVAKVFSMLFDKQMSNKVENRYNYILTSNKNVRIVGRLEEEDVTVSNLKELFANARIGDVVLTSGQYDYFQGMILTKVTDTGIEVYDCDSKYGKIEDEYYDLIQQYELTYEWMADAFSKNGVYHSKPGISIYRATRKISNVSSDNSLNKEEYDDSINYVIKDGVLTAYNGSRTTIEIPDGVTKIGDNCFNEKSIKYVYMPDTVVEIGLDAFASCYSLQYIKFSSYITKIDSRAFYSCSSLRNVTLPRKLDYIGAYCFYKSGLNSINFPDSTRLIDWHSFQDCVNLKTVTLGKGVRLIGEWAFAGCDNLNTIYWNADPGSEYYDYEDAFVHCGSSSEQLTVVFADDILKIPDKAMETCYYLTDIVFPETLVSIGERAFAHCGKLKSITIPQNVSFIGAEAFNFCGGLKTIYWNAENVTDFSYDDGPLTCVSTECEDLKVIFGNTVKSIPSYVLQNCSQVNEIVIGNNVERIGEGAFEDCNVEELLIPDCVTTIEWAALNRLNKISNLIIPDSVINLAELAIQNCDDLKNITLPSSVDYNNMSGLHCLKNLKNIYISDRSEMFCSIDGVLYGKDSSNTLAKVPNGRTTITILKECQTIWSEAFTNNDSLLEIAVETGNTAFSSIDGNLYSYDKEKFIKYAAGKTEKEFYIPQNVKTIDYRAFAGANLNDIFIPDSVENIDRAVFENCKNIERISLPDGISKISDFMFNFSGISDVLIPSTVTEIGRCAFQQCKNLTSITIPKSMESIGDGSFAQCTNLTDIYYDGTAVDWSKISIGLNNDCLYNATKHFDFIEENDKETEGLLEYDYQTDAWVDEIGEINFPYFTSSTGTFVKVYSKKYADKYALMDLKTGELLLDNLDSLGLLSEYSDLLLIKTNSENLIYNLDVKSVCCKLSDTYGLGYGGHFSEYGGFVTLSSDNKLHFISNDGIIGNAVDINHDIYRYENRHLMTWSYLGEGLYQLVVGESGGWTQMVGAVNTQGEVITYVDYIDNFINGLAIVKKNGKYGVIDKNGDYVINYEYEKIDYRRQEKIYVALKENVYYDISTSGDILNAFPLNLELYDGVSYYLCNGLKIVYNKDSNYFNWKYGIVNSSNEIVLPIAYSQIYAYGGFSEGLCNVSLSETYMGKSVDGYIDKYGNIIIPFEYEYSGSFSEGLAVVGKNNKYGYIDKYGTLVIPYEYDGADIFSEGLAAVCKDEKWGYINSSGEVIIPFEYVSAGNFSNGVAEVCRDYSYSPVFIDKENKIVSVDTDMPMYSLTYNCNYLENEYYTGGIKINKTNQVVDISKLKIRPIIIGENGEFIIAFSSDMEKMYKLNIKCDDNVGISIDNLNISDIGETATLSITVLGDVSTVKTLYVASYDSRGKLLGLQVPTFEDGIARATLPTKDVDKFKAFVWSDNLKPLCELKECNLNQ